MCFGWVSYPQKNLVSSSPYVATIEAVMARVCSGTLPSTGPSVFQSKEIMIEVSQQMQVATEADLRKRLGLSRVPRTLLKTLPSLELPGETGATETHYAFLGEEGAFKNCTMKQVLTCALETETLEQGKEYWDGQGEKTWLHSVGVQGKASGIASLLRDPHRVLTFQEWKATKCDSAKESGQQQQQQAPQYRPGRGAK